METREYCIEMDVTFATRVYVYATDVDSAKSQAKTLIENDPFYHSRYGWYLDNHITEVYEETEE